MSKNRIYLSDRDLPQAWYNIQADLPEPIPPALNPATQQPLGPADLSAIFPMDLITQEVSTERWIDIPGEVLDIYPLWRPSPVCRATRLEQELQTPAEIYYKYEGGSPSGSHKLNTAVAQVYFNKKAGIKHLTTETGAGQWGSALSLACSFFGLDCTVYMVKVSYDQKPYRKTYMETFGARVLASPSNETETGRKVLASDPDSLGSLGIAISEAVEVAASRPDTNYTLGSVLNHVLLHQSVIGLEAKAQLASIDRYPDIIIACHGGGSNLGGLIFPFLPDKFQGKRQFRAIAVEPRSCPTLTRGQYLYDFGDLAGFTPLMKMYTLGHEFIPPGIHAGGLRYHGASPLVSKLYHDGYIEAQAYDQTEVFDSAVQFARCEGILPAPESAHAIHAAIVEALKARDSGEKKVILFGLTGHGHFDLTAYSDYHEQKLVNVPYTEEMLAEGLKTVPKVE